MSCRYICAVWEGPLGVSGCKHMTTALESSIRIGLLSVYTCTTTDAISAIPVPVCPSNERERGHVICIISPILIINRIRIRRTFETDFQDRETKLIFST